MLQSPLLRKYCGGAMKASQGPAKKVLDHTNTECWPGHAPEPGEPKTKISSRTGRRVNNCS